MNLQPLLEYIRVHEARNSYDTIWGGISKRDYPSRPLTEMSVQAVLDWQDSIDTKYMSEAAGGYQFLEDTLRSSVGPKSGVGPKDKFNAETQDKLAIYLLKQRGLGAYVRGEKTAEDFANSLAHEWASLPLVSGPKKGRGVYDGDGLNKAQKDVEGFLAVVRAVKEPGPAVVPAVKPSFWAAIAALIAKLFGRAKA